MGQSSGFVTERTASLLCSNVSNRVFPQAAASNNEHVDFSTVRTLPIHPFQQERDADADEKDWPDPTGVDMDHAHA